MSGFKIEQNLYKVVYFFWDTRYNVLIFSIVSAKRVEVPIVLSEDCYCDLSVQILIGYTIS